MLLLETPDPEKKWSEAVREQENSPQLKVNIRPQIENSCKMNKNRLIPRHPSL